MSEKSQKYKITALKEIIHSNENPIPFFIITESHLKSRHYDHEIYIEDYTSLRADRPTINKGGVIIYMHNDFTMEDKEIYADETCQAAMVYNSIMNLIIIAIYRPPRADDRSFKACLNKIDSFIDRHDDADIQMMGDLNFPFINWRSREINRTNRLTSEIVSADNLLSFMDQNLLNQMATEPTRNNPDAILDLVITNNSQSIHNILVEKTKYSDHNFVWTQLSYTDLMTITVNPNHQPDSPLDSLNLIKANFEEIRKDLKRIKWDEVLKDRDVEEISAFINETLIQSCSEHAPKRKPNSKNKPFIPRNRRSLLKIRSRLNHKINMCTYLLTNVPAGRLERLNKKKAEIEIKIRDAIKEEAVRNENRALEKIKSNPRAFYTYHKSKSKTYTSIGPLLDEANRLQSDPQKMSNILQHQYLKVFSNPDTGEKNQPMPDTSNVPEFDDINITEEDIIAAINEISPYSAPGPDKIPAILIKEVKNEIAPALKILWQTSIDQGQIPSDLLKQTIIPIFKKENKSLASNYRPISLTSHLIKVFERVLRDKLIAHLESNNLITNHQHGFRSKRSTLTQLLDHINSILEILERNENADVILLDMAKAFDTVNHQILVHKLENMKITGKILTWIKLFLTKRSQTVVVNGHKSDPAHVTSGVPQGTVLGPALFILYINNITEFIKSSIIKLFADDSKLIASIKTLDDREKLISDLSALTTWTEMNSMRFNEDKFQLLQIGPHDNLKQPYSTNGTEIKKSEYVKDLGIYISEDLSYKYHITEMTRSASNYASWLLRTFRSRNQEVMLLLHKTYIIPRLEYASAVWNPAKISEIEQIEAVQRTFTSKIEDLDHMNYHERLQHLKLYSLQRRRERFIILHTFKIYKSLAPNDLKLEFKNHPRLGPQCKRLPLKSKITRIKNLRFNFFSHSAPRLFNLIPGKIKMAKTLGTFKKLLDKLLNQIPDTPPTPGYKRVNSNSLLEWGRRMQAVSVMMTSTEDRHLADDRGQNSRANTVVAPAAHGGS